MQVHTFPMSPCSTHLRKKGVYPAFTHLPRHVFEIRIVYGELLRCALIDSVQSQANRLEEALLTAANPGNLRISRIVVDFASTGLDSVPEISMLEAPHRIFDATMRDSLLGQRAAS
ncbi:MAG: type I-G CRISPR-associated RAMP protein Csb1/Cas7g [Gammaproteobacteria bacterium]